MNRRVFFVCFASLSFCLRKRTAKPGGSSLRPGFGSSLAQVWQVPLGVRGTPCAPGGHAGRAASRPRPDRPRSSGRPEREEKGRTGRPRARTLRAPGAHTARPGTSSDVQHARLPARRTARLTARRTARLPARRTARLSARRTARLPARRAACPPARERRVYRRAN